MNSDDRIGNGILLGLMIGLGGSLVYESNIQKREASLPHVRHLDLIKHPDASVEDFLYPFRNEYLLAYTLPILGVVSGGIIGGIVSRNKSYE